MPRRRTTTLIGVLTAVLVIVTACATQETDDAPPADDQAESQPTPSTEPSPTAQPTVTASTVVDTPTPEQSEDASEVSNEESSGLGASQYATRAASSQITLISDGDDNYQISHVLPKDAIQAIFDPRMITTVLAFNQYRDTDLVIGVSINGDHRAYNVAHLSSHEVVNDVVGGQPVAVTW